MFRKYLPEIGFEGKIYLVESVSDSVAATLEALR
jgi:hypothetical protein